jgi:hypothetical protein
MECEFCKNTFSNKSSLVKHQKRTKYCIGLREEKGLIDDIKKEVEIKCFGCEKVFTSKENLKYHTEKCINLIIHDLEEKYKKEIAEQKEFYEKQIVEYKEQIKQLQNEITNIAKTAVSRPITINNQHNNQLINNQIINNLIPISEEHLIEQSKYLTLEHIKNGASGYVQYALEYPLKDRIKCVDYSRKRIKYKDEEGNIIDDPEMSKLSQKFFKAIEEPNSKLTDEYLKELQSKLSMLNNQVEEINEEDKKEFDEQSNLLIDYYMKINAQRREIREAANGYRPEIYLDFVKDICSKVA